MRIRRKARALIKSAYIEASAVPFRAAYPLLRRLTRAGRPKLLLKPLVALFAPAFVANKRPHKDFECETVFGFRMAGNTRDFIPAEIDLFGMIEGNLSYWFLEQLRPGDVFVDVGAHIGYFTLFAATGVGKTGSVVAIEASPTTFELLTRNIALNPAFENIRAVNVAAGAAEGSVAIYRSPAESTGTTSINKRKGNLFEAEVSCLPLHRILTPTEWQRMRIVKIDVEGAEFQTVEGLLSSALAETRPDLEIAVETSQDWTFHGRRGSVDDLIQLFQEWGFNAYGMKKEMLVDPVSMFRPVRLDKDPGWGYFDLVFSRRDCGQL